MAKIPTYLSGLEQVKFKTSPKKRNIAKRFYKPSDCKFLGNELAKIEAEMREQNSDSVSSHESRMCGSFKIKNLSSQYSDISCKEKEERMDFNKLLEKEKFLSSTA